MMQSDSNRIIPTPSAYAREHFWYVQEIGTLKSLSPHISRRQNLHSYLFLIVLEGKGVITYKNETYNVKAGDCAFLDCTKPYSHKSDDSSQWELMWVHFYGNTVPAFYSFFIGGEVSAVFTPFSLSEFEDILSKLYELQLQKKSTQELESHRLLTNLVVLCSSSQYSDTSESYILSDKLQAIHTYLTENYAKKITLDSIAAEFFISKYYLVREYKKAFGITLQNDLTAIRISHAKSLLRFSPDSMEDIALSCGFQNASYFTKVFKKEENVTPLFYRKKW